MEVVCVGAGPAGLYFAILTKLRDPDAKVTVLERNPEGETFGWGVTYSDDVLDVLYEADPVSAQHIHRDPASWRNQVVVVNGEVGHMGGYGFAIGRHELLRLLAERARGLGVSIHYDHPVDGPTALGEYAGADLVVAADGVNSGFRDANPEFGTEVESGNNHFMWLGARPFREFTYGFEKTSSGWIFFSAYPFNAKTSTFIPECSPATWKGLGFDEMTIEESLRALEEIFERHLDYVPLWTQTRSGTGEAAAPWAQFKWITNRAWHAGNVVLLGDAAHTAHYSIGNGTKLALEDAVELDRQLSAHPGDQQDALHAYQAASQPRVEQRQRIARASARWFEQIDATTPDINDPVKFAFHLRNAGAEPPPTTSGVSWMLHRATQLSAGRWARSKISSTKRRERARETRTGT